VVVELVVERLEGALHVGEVHDPAAVGARLAGHLQFHREGMAVQARALVPGRHVRQAVRGLDAEDLEDVHLRSIAAGLDSACEQGDRHAQASWCLALLGLGLVLPAAPALAQTPEDALTAAWLQVCPGALPGSELAQRCAEIAAAARQPRRRRRRQLPRGNPRPGPQLHARARRARERAARGHQREAVAVRQRRHRPASTATEPNEAAFDGNTDSITVGLDWASIPHGCSALALSHDQERWTSTKAAARRAAIHRRPRLPELESVRRARPQRLRRPPRGSNELERAIDYTCSAAPASAPSPAPIRIRRARIAGLGLDWSLAQGAWGWLFGAGVD
jgi:hypothetical protein